MVWFVFLCMIFSKNRFPLFGIMLGRIRMWYFSWVLGLGLAATVGILNALWYELRTVRERDESTPPMRTP
jgi:cyd operon protein YbgT